MCSFLGAAAAAVTAAECRPAYSTSEEPCSQKRFRRQFSRINCVRICVRNVRTTKGLFINDASKKGAGGLPNDGVRNAFLLLSKKIPVYTVFPF